MEEYKIVENPWGREVWVEENEKYICRILHLKKDCAVSLQYHKHKLETLYVISGKATYIFQRPGEEKITRTIGPGDILNHKPYEVHREIAIEDTVLFEVCTPEIDDIIRLEDSYGRENK